MSNINVGVFLCLTLMIFLPKVQPQDTPADGAMPAPANPPAPAAANEAANNPESAQPAPAPAPAPAASSAPNNNMNAPAAQSATSDIAEYLNRRIRQVLNENPAKDPSELTLAAIFNEERSKLENALITGTPTEQAYSKAEQAIDNFKSFSQRYTKVENMLENALENLNSYEEDITLPLAVRYEALMLLLKLKKSSTLKNAEKSLKLYDDFKNTLNGNAKPSASGTPSSSTPPLSAEYAKYFEEILKILRKHMKKDTPEMESFLQQILKYPEQLKKLYEALQGISDDDSNDDDDDGDFFFDLFSFFKFF